MSKVSLSHTPNIYKLGLLSDNIAAITDADGEDDPPESIISSSAESIPAPVPPAQVPVLEPEQVFLHGRQRRSTQRDPSHFFRLLDHAYDVGERVRQRQRPESYYVNFASLVFDGVLQSLYFRAIDFFLSYNVACLAGFFSPEGFPTNHATSAMSFF